MKLEEIQLLGNRQSDCLDVIWDSSSFICFDWKDPAWLGHIRDGYSKHTATIMMRDGMASALRNLAKQREHGEGFSERREAEYEWLEAGELAEKQWLDSPMEKKSMESKTTFH